jgi:2'-hydroxyisoflavone reductase
VGQPVQIIDARDLAEWNVRLAEARTAGTFNATGPARPLTLGELLWTCRQVSGSGARLEWVDEAFLLARDVGNWSELPVVVPESNAQLQGMAHVDCPRAFAAVRRVYTDCL